MIEKLRALAETGLCKIPRCVDACPLKSFFGKTPTYGNGECQRVAKEYLAKNDPQEKPVTAFEAGKWYKWVGPKERPTCWPEEQKEAGGQGLRDYVLSYNPMLCVKAIGEKATFSYPGCADARGYSDYLWNWSMCMGNFHEVPVPTETRIHSAVDYAPGSVSFSCTVTLPKGFCVKLTESESERSARLLATIKTKN